MSDLNDWVPTLQRSVAPPSMFATYYPNATLDDLAGILMDAFCECQIDGFFVPNFSLDLNTGIITPDLDAGSLRLVTIYGAVVMLRTTIINVKSKAAYRAGNAESDVEYSPNVLTAVLKSLETAKQVTIQRLLQSGAAYAISMVDQALIRATAPFQYSQPYPEAYDRSEDFVDPWSS